jgi:hypothetical protein
MQGSTARRARIVASASLYFCLRNPAALGLASLALALTSCAHRTPDATTEAEINVFPTNYKSDILGAMHAYLNDPTGIRDAAISDPALKTVANTTRYTVCIRFNAKKNGSKDYAGSRQIAAVFQVGKFDRFIDSASNRDANAEANSKEPNLKDLCAGVTYAPFPELQQLPP